MGGGKRPPLRVREQLGDMGRVEHLPALARRMQRAGHEHRIDSDIAGAGDVGVKAVANGQNWSLPTSLPASVAMV